MYEAITLVNGLLLIYSNDINSISSSVKIYITLNPTICFITPTKALSVYSKPSNSCFYTIESFALMKDPKKSEAEGDPMQQKQSPFILQEETKVKM